MLLREFHYRQGQVCLPPPPSETDQFPRRSNGLYFLWGLLHSTTNISWHRSYELGQLHCYVQFSIAFLTAFKFFFAVARKVRWSSYIVFKTKPKYWSYPWARLVVLTFLSQARRHLQNTDQTGKQFTMLVSPVVQSGSHVFHVRPNIDTVFRVFITLHSFHVKFYVWFLISCHLESLL
jgi:hypothetical protein